MTDNDIIKALECCTSEEGDCEDCPYGRECFDDDSNFLLEDVLDLINRQKAEIERLQAQKVTALRRTIESAKANAKAEAIKEFAERLKSTPCRFREEQTIRWDKPPITKMVLFIDDNDIDNLVKEMTEETKHD